MILYLIYRKSKKTVDSAKLSATVGSELKEVVVAKSNDNIGNEQVIAEETKNEKQEIDASNNV